MTISVLRARTGRAVYREVLGQVLAHGRYRSPRGLKTLDLGMCVIELTEPTDALPLGMRPQLSKRVAAAEAIQLIGGFSNPKLMLDASPRFARYAESDGRFHGAYGQRVGMQVALALRKLVRDRETRQAVVTLWDPSLDNQVNKKDYPCTVALRFSLENDALCLDVIMRSNDAWLGLPYDLFQFTQLQLTAARTLGVIAGSYRHTVWSMHLYTDDLPSAELAAVAHLAEGPPYTPDGIDGLPLESPYFNVQNRARALAAPGSPQWEPPWTRGEEWYRAQLLPRAVVDPTAG